jgi:hypothetical protein
MPAGIPAVPAVNTVDEGGHKVPMQCYVPPLPVTPAPMERKVVLEARDAFAADEHQALEQSNASVAQLSETHVKQRGQLEDYHVNVRQDDSLRRWDERQEQQSDWQQAKAAEAEKQLAVEKAQREREAAEEAAAAKREEETRLAKEGSLEQTAVLREWTTEFRRSPVATGSPVAPECSIAFNQVESFPTSPSLTKSAVGAVGRPTMDVSQIKAERLVLPAIPPQKQAEEDSLQQMEQRLEMEMDRVSALNIFHAQQARERRLQMAKAMARREMGDEQARAAKQAEELEESLRLKIHKISGRQALAGGTPRRKPRSPLTKAEEQEIADRLSAPKEIFTGES